MKKHIPLSEIRNRLKKVHADSFKYPYLEYEYKTVTSKVTVICPLHGTITKTLNSLFSGSGCPLCGSLKRVISKHSNKRKSHLEMNRFYAFIKDKFGEDPYLTLPNKTYSDIAASYIRMRLNDGLGRCFQTVLT